MKTNANDRIHQHLGFEEHQDFKEGDITNCGLTKREYFASHALMGLIQNKVICESKAKMAVDLADALIAELNRTSQS